MKEMLISIILLIPSSIFANSLKMPGALTCIDDLYGAAIFDISDRTRLVDLNNGRVYTITQCCGHPEGELTLEVFKDSSTYIKTLDLLQDNYVVNTKDLKQNLSALGKSPTKIIKAKHVRYDLRTGKESEEREVTCVASNY